MGDVPEKPYREGCDEGMPQQEEKPPMVPRIVSDEEIEEAESDELKESGQEQETESTEQEEAQPEDENKVIPETAFLIVKHVDGRIEATTTLPGFQMQRQAGLRDLRDITHGLYLDVMSTIQGKVVAQEMGSSLQQAMVKQQISRMAQGMKK